MILSYQEHPVTIVLLGLVVVIFLSSLAIKNTAKDLLGLAWTSPTYLWAFVTAHALEPSFIKFIFSFMGILRFSPIVERSISSKGLVLYLLFITVGASIAACSSMVITYVITRSEYVLQMKEFGILGVVSALSVAAVQANPTECVFPQISGILARYLPLVLFMVTGCLKIIQIRTSSSFCDDFLFIGLTPFLGWLYLRFIKGGSGDTQAHFAFANFFPKHICPYVGSVCDFSYGVVRLLGVFKDRDARISPGNSFVVKDDQDDDLSHITNPVAERRRVRALKLLDKKFQELEDPREGNYSGGATAHNYEFGNTGEV